LGIPEYSLRSTLPEVPAVSPGAVTEKVALWIPPQFERANQPWYGEMIVGGAVSLGACS
jgi:hypothetical protein